MNKFTKKDLVSSLVTGFYTGFIAWQVFEFLEVPVFNRIFGLISWNIDISSVWMIVLIPILWILGVNLGYFLGQWMVFFNQFGKFSAIGFTNFFVYLAILNFFIWKTDIAVGIWYSIFVSIAFVVSVIHSYGWNKYWVFQSSDDNSAGEFGKFVIVTVIAGLINVGVASSIVNFIDPVFGVSPEGWANIGGVAGSAVALVFSFVGIRLIVFKKRENVIS